MEEAYPPTVAAPTAADYAWSAAYHADDKAQQLKQSLEALLRRVQDLEHRVALLEGTVD